MQIRHDFFYLRSMSLNKLVFAIATIALAACGSTKTVKDNTEQPGEDIIANETDAGKIWVNSFIDNCDINAPNVYYLQTQEGTEKPDGNWDCLHQTIQGFVFEPGYLYQLEVKSVITEGLPSLSLIQVISKERDPDYFRIYDIWAATHMNGEVLDVTATRPNLEINLTTMKIMGKGMCNQYFGKIEKYTTSTIKFGPIAGTKMMCPEIKQEQLFLEALKVTTSFEIKSMTLRLFNSNKEEVLRFQKVD
jgi:heat shock protein HslJ